MENHISGKRQQFKFGESSGSWAADNVDCAAALSESTG